MTTQGWRTAALAVLLSYSAVLLYVLLTPDGGLPSSLLTASAERLRSFGAPERLLLPTRFEFACNVVVVVPVALLAVLLWRSHGWTFWTGWVFAASLSVEAIQALLLDDRSATFSDVVANTAGAMVGAVAAGLFLTSRRVSQGSK